jgi:hypothetical protein
MDDMPCGLDGLAESDHLFDVWTSTVNSFHHHQRNGVDPV